MPTYEYRCEACAHEFEEFQSITAEPLRKCPSCGKRKLHRLLGTGGGIIFKGSGFYQTDYRSDSYRKAAEAEKSNGKTSADAKNDAVKAGEKTAKTEGSKPVVQQRVAADKPAKSAAKAG